MIGWGLIRSLLDDGFEVRTADILPKSEWQEVHDDAQNFGLCDLREPVNCKTMVDGCDYVWNLAFSMGGIEHLYAHPFDCIESSSITTHMLRASIDAGVQRFFVSSSACAYAARFQTDPNVTALSEDMAWPAEPERGYGTAKLMDEEQCWAAREQYGLETRVARYHNIYSGGPTTWEGGKEKAPAAICRKVATAVATGADHIVLLGDGKATRSYCWLGDCVTGTRSLMESDYPDPVNIGSSELVSVDELADMVCSIAGVELEYRHDTMGAEGVRGRNSCNDLCRKVLHGWEPSTPLRVGMERLYSWVEGRVMEQFV